MTFQPLSLPLSLRYLAIAGMMGSVSTLFAQSSTSSGDGVKTMDDLRTENMINSTHVITEGGVKLNRDSVNNLLSMFYEDQYRHFQDPRAPYFMFLSRDGNLAMGVGGLIRMRGFFDWNGSIPSSGFAPYMIPIPKDQENLRKLWATPAGTGLFFTILGNNSVVGDFMGYIQADFSGYQNRGFKLKKAYLQNKHWTVGYAKTTFEDTSAEPNTIDGAGPNGISGKTNVLVRYTTTFKEHWSVAGSFEFPSSAIQDDDDYTKPCSDYVPDIAAFIQYQWAGGDSHVRLSALGRVLSYRDLIESKNNNIFGWATQLSTTISVGRALQLYGIASIGKGHASYTADLGISNYDLIAKPGEKGEMYAPTSVGYVLGARYYFTPKVFSNIALSEQRFYPKENPHDSQYKYGLYGAVNVFWDITPRVEMGAEYLAGKRMNFNGAHDNANRLTAMIMFSF